MDQKPFIFDTRQDLNPKMTSRRRLPHPTRSDTLLSDLPDIFGPSQPGVSYAEFIGVLETEPTPAATTSPFQTHGFPGESFPFMNLFGAGSSHANDNPYPTFQKSGVREESGWIKDAFGRDFYAGHGKIEEVDDEAENDKKEDGDDNDLTPRAKAARLSRHSSDIYSHPDTIPFNSTPPPGPRPRKLPSLKATTTLSEFNFKSNIMSPVPTEPATPPLPPLPTLPETTTTPAPNAALDDDTEVSYVKEIVKLLESCMEDVEFMGIYFQAQEDDLAQHIETCTRIEESLRSLRNTMSHRTKMGSEEWGVRSPLWHQKYCRRLVSLRTTLYRLSRMRKLIGDRPLRPQQSRAMLTKLEQHEAKLADIASKYIVSFDRLRLRHLHFLLTQSSMQSKQQKEARLTSRASFERKWQAGKDFRAGLRYAFNELRQEFYSNNQRPPRHPAAP